MQTDMLTRVRGLEFSYRVDGAGPTLALIHAFPLNKRMWEPQLAELSRHCSVVTLDLRGFGASQVTDGLFTIDDLADDVHALMQALGHTTYVLGGLSLGGYVALAHLRRHPEALRGLILADTKAGADSAEAREKRFKNIAAVEASGARPLAMTMPATLFAASTQQQQPALLDTARSWIEETDPRTLIGTLRAMAERPDAGGLLAGVRVPSLVIVGAHDAITPPAEAQAMAAAIPEATLATIPNAGHLSNLENPDAFNAAVAAFMARFPD